MARFKYNEEVPNNETAPPIFYPEYRVVQVKQGCRTWYEVRGVDGRYSTENKARRVANSFNKNVEKIKSRVGVDLG